MSKEKTKYFIKMLNDKVLRANEELEKKCERIPGTKLPSARHSQRKKKLYRIGAG